MSSLAPLTPTELDAAVERWHRDLGDPATRSRAELTASLRDLHELLMRSTARSPEPPDALTAVAAVVATVSAQAVDALAPRPRTALRLLRAGAAAAAWQVLTENAVGVVAEDFHDSTATGAARTSWRLPVPTRIEPPAVYAELPGFRDPRFNAPDECYDISGAIGLKAQLDEIVIDGARLTLGGWAALDVLAASVTETVRVVLSAGPVEIVTTGRRVRRPDLVTGKGEALVRRAWAGWSCVVELNQPRLVDGNWSLFVEVDHDGIVRRAPIGRRPGDVAVTAAAATVQYRDRRVQWKTDGQPWQLIVSSGSRRGG
jgi:hypothetical protein